MIIVTGNHGFVGRNATRYFKTCGYDVKAVTLRNEEWRISDWHEVKALIHLAGKAHDTSNTSASEEYFRINRDLTMEVFRKFLNSETRDFFYFSSVKAVADTVESTLTEEALANPFTPYGRSKLEAEQLLLNTKLPDGKRLFIIRPCMIHGPENKGNLNMLFKVVSKNFPWPLAAFDNSRSFIGIDNLCYLINQMIRQTELPSGVYNFADDDALSTNEIITIISKTLGRKPKLWPVPKSIIKVVAKIGDQLSLPLNSERLKKLTESYVVSNQKIKSALGIEKLPLTAQEGMVQTIRSFADTSK